MNLLRYLPNLLTGLRLLLALPVAWVILEERYDQALLLAILAGLTDALDGFLARHLDAVTALGAILDPLADKLLILVVFGSAALVGLLPWWLTALVILRDLTILTGAIAYRLLFGSLQVAPTRLSKANMVLQITFLALVLADALQVGLPAMALPTLMVLVAVLAVLSGFQYVVLWTHKARIAKRRGHA